MVTKQLLDYVRTQKGLGTSVDTIKNNLEVNGWVAPDIESALSEIQTVPTEPAPDPAVKPAIQRSALIDLSIQTPIVQPPPASYTPEQVAQAQKDWMARNSGYNSIAPAKFQPYVPPQNAKDTTPPIVAKKKNNFAGCVVALIFVVGIISIFVSRNVILRQVMGLFSSNHAVQLWLRKNDLYPIRRSLVQYNLDNLSYPDELSELVPGYMKTIPVDPITKTDYSYISTDDKHNFELCIPVPPNSQACTSEEIPVDKMVPIAK